LSRENARRFREARRTDSRWPSFFCREQTCCYFDEPTNHLDIRSIEWLEKFLKDTAKNGGGRFRMIASSSTGVVNRILEIDQFPAE